MNWFMEKSIREIQRDKKYEREQKAYQERQKKYREQQREKEHGDL